MISITSFHSGTTHNVIPDRATMLGTVRSFDPELRKRAPELIERVIKGVCEAHGATYELNYEFGYRALINTDWVAEQLKAIALETVGPDHFRDAKPTMGGEDFSAYLEKAPARTSTSAPAATKKTAAGHTTTRASPSTRPAWKPA